METGFPCAINDAGLPRRRHPLRRRRHSSSHAIVVLTAFFIAVESQLAIIGHGIPISPNGPSPIPTPLLFDEEEAASIPAFVTMQLDDLVTTYRRHNENGEGDAAFADLDQWRRDLDGELEPKQTEDEAAHVVTLKRGKDFLQTRGSSALDDERSGSSDAALESLKAEVARQAGEIGGLTEELIADKKEIVELRVVVCNMMSALCDTKGSPCLPCPWRDLPTTTSAPTTTTTSTSPPPQTTTTTTMAKTTTAEPTTTTFTKPSTAPSTTTVKTTTTAVTVTSTPAHNRTTALPTTKVTPTATTKHTTNSTGTTSSKPPTSTTKAPATTTKAPTTITTKAPTTTTKAPTTTTKAPTTTTKAPTTTTKAPTTTTKAPTTTTTKNPTTTTTHIPTPDPNAKCSKPKPPDNGFIIGNETKLGSQVEIKCKPGFTLVGVPRMECTALWSDESHSFSYNWAPPMSAVCKPNASYLAVKPGKHRQQSNRNRRNATNEACGLPPVVGPCRGAFRRYFFNPSSGFCEPFIYGGCRGNANNFVSHRKCAEACLA